jgi:DNA helicase-2/ATP-dependent DNA helicase PcrA
VKTLVLKKATDLQTRYSIAYEKELNAEQLQAVMHRDGPALVIAGAGTGKTRILTYRLARLVESGVPPESIVLLTFTRKAANEMMRRASLLLDGRCERVQGGTFHSFAHTILRRYGALIDLDSNFTILDQTDAEDAINLIRSRLQFDKSKKRFPLKNTLLSMYSMSVNCYIPIDDVIAQRYSQFSEYTEAIHTVLREFVAFKRSSNVLDYDDLLVYLLRLLEQSEQGREAVLSTIRYIMVDEYQDTNKLQHHLVKKLTDVHKNIMVVGDDAQSIYSFRGAEAENIFDFEKEHHDTAVIAISKNYRSTNQILSVSNHTLKQALHSYHNVLQSDKNGTKPFIVATKNERQQSVFITQLLLQQREEGVALDEIAVLFRSGFMSFDLEIELQKANIPFKKYGGLRFSETAHLKDLLAIVKILHNPHDIISWYRILLLLDGVGPKSASIIIEEIQRNSEHNYWMSPNVNKPVRGFDTILNLCSLLHQLNTDDASLTEIVTKVSNFYRPLLQKKYDDYSKRLKDIDTIISISSAYTSITSFLSDMTLEGASESVTAEHTGNENEFVTLSTIHSAKGLEWKTVFIIWALDGRFPSTRSLESVAALEEERRLFYVAVTRAKDELVITYPIDVFDRESGMVLGEPSRFLQGMDEDMIERFVVMEEQ